jgi:hypothetical protein
MSLFDSKQRKKKEYKDDFFKTILIQFPCNPFKGGNNKDDVHDDDTSNDNVPPKY